MYCEYFGLSTLPFNNTPDPRFFFQTPDHEEALASLLYATQGRKGFVLVTGEVGAGKTLLSRLLLTRLGSTVRTALVTNTRLSGRQLLAAICREFNLPVGPPDDVPDLSYKLEKFLLEQYSRDRLAVVILDEAQNLPIEAFEELRMLGNLEADDAKLLQVLILGQPELNQTFRQPAMHQLQQRIFRSFHLEGLPATLVRGYIHHRLSVAGLADGEEIFNVRAIHAIHRHSKGVPRVINQICDNAMLAAYASSIKVVGPEIIDEVVRDLMALHEPINVLPRDPRSDQDPPRDPPGDQPSPVSPRDIEALRQLAEENRKAIDEMRTKFDDGFRPDGKFTQQARTAVQQHVAELAAAADEARAARDRYFKEIEETANQLHAIQENAASTGRESTKDWTALRTTLTEAKTELLSDIQKVRQDVRSELDHSVAMVETRIMGFFNERQNEYQEIEKTIEPRITALRTDVEAISNRFHSAEAETIERVNRMRRSVEDDAKTSREQWVSLQDGVAQARAQWARDIEEAEARLKHGLDGLPEALNLRIKPLTDAAEARVERLKTELEDAASGAERTISHNEQRGGHLKDEMQKFFDTNATKLQKTSQVLDKTAEELAARTSHLEARCAEFSQTIDASVNDARRALGTAVTGALRQAEELRGQAQSLLTSTHSQIDQAKVKADAIARAIASDTQRAQSFHSVNRESIDGMIKRLTDLRTASESAMEHSEDTVARIRMESKGSLAEVRESLAQMTHRAASAHSDFTQLSESLKQDLRENAAILNSQAVEIKAKIEALRESADRDAQAQETRLGALVQRVEHGAGQARQNAAKLMDQVQVSSSSMLSHATDVVNQAQRDADRLARQAKEMLTAAQVFSEETHQKSEQLRTTNRDEAATIREEMKRVAGEIELLRGDLTQTREQSSDILDEATRLQDRARAKADELIEKTREVGDRCEALLQQPQQIVDDANRSTAALGDLCTKVSAAVRQLTLAGDQAEQQRRDITEANTIAGDRLDQLKKHSQRLGQLVGIIRQLYGAMDARIDKLRQRLGVAEQWARSVPQEIDALQEMFTPEIASTRNLPEAPRVAKPKTPAPATTGGGSNQSLGQIAQRNQKLNAWLKDVLNEDQKAAVAQPPNRIPASQLTPKQIPA